MDGDSINGCVSSEILARLAIRLLSGERGRAARAEPVPAGLPERLFETGEESLRDHLDRCRLCRARLLAEIHQYREYIEGLEEEGEAWPGIAAGSGGAASPADEGNIVELEYLPYDAGRSGGALAADTSATGRKPLRFASRDREYILRQSFDSVENRWFVQLTGLLPVSYDEIRVIVDGEESMLDERGYVRFEGEGGSLDEESVIRLRFPV